MVHNEPTQPNDDWDSFSKGSSASTPDQQRELVVGEIVDRFLDDWDSELAHAIVRESPEILETLLEISIGIKREDDPERFDNFASEFKDSPEFKQLMFQQDTLLFLSPNRERRKLEQLEAAIVSAASPSPENHVKIASVIQQYTEARASLKEPVLRVRDALVSRALKDGVETVCTDDAVRAALREEFGTVDALYETMKKLQAVGVETAKNLALVAYSGTNIVDDPAISALIDSPSENSPHPWETLFSLISRKFSERAMDT